MAGQSNQNALQCFEAFDIVIKNINQTFEALKAISSSSQEQAHGVEQIATAVSQLENSNQSSSTIVDTTAMISKSLSDKSNELLNTLEVMKNELLGMKAVAIAQATEIEEHKNNRNFSKAA